MKDNAAFTLIELMVAMAVFAVLSVIAYGGLNNIIKTSEVVEAQAERLKELQIFMAVVQKDMQNIVPRTVRDELGDVEAEVKMPGGGARTIDFTRGGQRNLLKLPRSDMQRVGYELRENQLLRVSYMQLDRAPGTEPLEQVLLEDVQDWQIRLLDDKNNWHSVWPPLNQTGTTTSLMPQAIELELTLKDWGDIRRLIRVYDP
ncbi:MAG TPA: type II secretion system protein GspJ [Gammaproteobacteria bacterium]|jgi:general secretion pathway protein J|nr:type II secretion system protein GspJ [Gammaproteobacteria bacterium]